MTNIAFIGTGYVSDYYMRTLENYPDLHLVGAWDRDQNRLKVFCTFYKVRSCNSLHEILNDKSIDIVVNLTTPESHFLINKAALDADKHVYCEKPLALSVEDAKTLISLAKEKGLIICGAPANALSNAFHLTKQQIKKGQIGRPTLVYAEMEDGPVFMANWQKWRSRSGAPWPGAHEFEIGCTLEHAGYALTWLIGLFGPVAHISAFSALTFPDKGKETRNVKLAPDFSVGCLVFRNGVVARLTCGLAAPRDRSMTILGEKGAIAVRDLWDNSSPINLSKHYKPSLWQRIVDGIESRAGRRLPFRLYKGKKLSYPSPREVPKLPAYPSQINFMAGVQEQAKAIHSGQTPFFSGQVLLHLTEVLLALHAGRHDYLVETSFDFSS
ncbi:Gfo/Idh/MocA family protein [Komagataeibacter sp. FNDCR2]|uniref:Gfo/Idh/MocA family protein n=1 Tax=Komagataeibacter sp. FNDCR2 TaxID=2878682 RepID=UPI001E52D0D0|nr:Gfo/Idh/MocA family oxidoreductase [Komagataeibacter sp. FNDCR2]MCE2576771.1 Gfo/Idh/MocA family oxidoreductase [Komagataeibacter sp. FNDCR2]